MRSQAGFTLLELMVALLVSAIVVGGARVLLVQVGDHSVAVSHAVADRERSVHAERLVRALAGRLEADPARGLVLVGEPHAVRFNSWCEVPGGWIEPCVVVLAFMSAGTDGAQLVLQAGTADPLILWRGSESPVGLRYLQNARYGGVWLPRWQEVAASPQALAVVRGGDTLIVRVGERG